MLLSNVLQDVCELLMFVTLSRVTCLCIIEYLLLMCIIILMRGYKLCCA